MPIDPRIALQYQSPDIGNPVYDYARTKNALLENKKTQMEMDAAKADQAEVDALKDYIHNTDITTAEGRAGLTKFGKRGLEFGKLLDDRRKSQMDAEKEQRGMFVDLVKFGLSNPDKIEGALDHYAKVTGDDVTDEKAELAQIGPDPEARRRWVMGHVASVQDQFPELKTLNLGDRTTVQGFNKVTGAPVGQGTTYREGLSPSEAARINREEDPNLVATTTTDNAGNVTHFNKRGQVIGTAPGAGKPTAAYEKNKNLKVQMKTDLDRAITELERASADGGLIDQSTGSGAGRLADVAARFVGTANEGDIAIGKLQPIADLALKMVPRFEGPQSDKDTQSYKEAAGQLADATMPREIRKAAAKEIVRLMKQRKGQFAVDGMDASEPVAPQTGGGASVSNW